MRDHQPHDSKVCPHTPLCGIFQPGFGLLGASDGSFPTTSSGDNFASLRIHCRSHRYTSALVRRDAGSRRVCRRRFNSNLEARQKCRLGLLEPGHLRYRKLAAHINDDLILHHTFLACFSCCSSSFSPASASSCPSSSSVSSKSSSKTSASRKVQIDDQRCG